MKADAVPEIEQWMNHPVTRMVFALIDYDRKVMLENAYQAVRKNQQEDAQRFVGYADGLKATLEAPHAAIERLRTGDTFQGNYISEYELEDRPPWFSDTGEADLAGRD